MTIRKTTIPVGDAARAARPAHYLLEVADAPQSFPPAGQPLSETIAPRPGANTMWLGAASTLAAVGVEPGREVVAEELALVLQGQHASTGVQVRRPGLLMRKRDAPSGSDGADTDEQPVSTSEPTWVVTCVDLTFSSPKSVSVLWSQADAELRAAIEGAMMSAANTMLGYMTETKPVVRMGLDEAGKRSFVPARGFAAAAALHVVARRAVGDTVPWPQLHVHGMVVGVERADGGFVAAETAGVYKRQAPLEGGAVARAVLARHLDELGFEIDRGTGRNGRFFELSDIPRPLAEAMSGRSRDVEREVDRVEADLDIKLLNRGRSVVAMKTRARKDKTLSAETIGQAWEAQAQEFGFGPAAVAGLRRPPGARPRPLEDRRATARTAIETRLGARKTPASPGAARAIAFECAAGNVSLADAHDLLEQQLPLDGGGDLTSEQIRAIEERSLPDGGEPAASAAGRGTGSAGASPIA